MWSCEILVINILYTIRLHGNYFYRWLNPRLSYFIYIHMLKYWQSSLDVRIFKILRPFSFAALKYSAYYCEHLHPFNYDFNQPCWTTFVLRSLLKHHSFAFLCHRHKHSQIFFLIWCHNFSWSNNKPVHVPAPVSHCATEAKSPVFVGHAWLCQLTSITSYHGKSGEMKFQLKHLLLDRRMEIGLHC